MRPGNYRLWQGFACACALTFLAGCGPSGPPLADVEGVVTLDGKPVKGATVTFISRKPNGSTSSGQTDADGHYTLMYTFDDEGALLGEHDVTITKPNYSQKERQEMIAAGMEVGGPRQIPARYSNVGELEATVESGGNVIDFKLSSKKPSQER